MVGARLYSPKASVLLRNLKTAFLRLVDLQVKQDKRSLFGGLGAGFSSIWAKEKKRKPRECADPRDRKSLFDEMLVEIEKVKISHLLQKGLRKLYRGRPKPKRKKSQDRILSRPQQVLHED